MTCNKCKGMIVMHTFSEGKCESCEVDVVTPHIPCYKLCDDCSENQSRCQQCGTKIEDNDKR